jgi:hypothetical protein
MGNREFWIVIAVAMAALVAIIALIHNPTTITWATLNPSTSPPSSTPPE